MLADLQRILVEALFADDPVAALRAPSDRDAPSLSEEERALLARVDPDGFALTSLLVKKLRFERLTGGDPSLAGFFENDPARFVEMFRRYGRAVPPSFHFPAEEGEAFRRFLESERTADSDEGARSSTTKRLP